MNDIFLHGRRIPVLLFHGLCGNPLELQLLAQRLHAAGHTVYVPFMPGYGKSLEDDTPGSKSQRWEDLAQHHLDQLVSRHGPVVTGGLCIGANLALRLASRNVERIAGLLLISTTLFYDGWSLPWYRFLLPIFGPTPLNRFYVLKEAEPYGVKNARIRDWIARQMKTTGVSAAGARDLPLNALYQAYRLMRRTRDVLPDVKQPALVMHAAEDEIASLRSPNLLCHRLGSPKVEKHIFANSYHMLTIDNDREAVARASVAFLKTMPHLESHPVGTVLPVAEHH